LSPCRRDRSAAKAQIVSRYHHAVRRASSSARASPVPFAGTISATPARARSSAACGADIGQSRKSAICLGTVRSRLRSATRTSPIRRSKQAARETKSIAGPRLVHAGRNDWLLLALARSSQDGSAASRYSWHRTARRYRSRSTSTSGRYSRYCLVKVRLHARWAAGSTTRPRGRDVRVDRGRRAARVQAGGHVTARRRAALLAARPRATFQEVGVRRRPTNRGTGLLSRDRLNVRCVNNP
jgi:hypothetical protein